MNKTQNDHAYMAEALRLAEQGLYTTRSNPRVGCVIVKHSQIIGRGFHVSPGNPHAEVMALNSVSETAEKSTVYVSLEPCAHHGNTPPCAEALVNAKVSRVVSAIADPNPLVNSKGLEHLQNNGIETTIDILAAEAEELNKGFFKRMTSGRPYITVKSAISLDGKTALASGESKWISSDESRIDVQKQRARSCAIMTGIDTVIADNPSLTVRLDKDQLGMTNSDEHEITQPKRVILDTQLRIAANAKILQQPEEVIIYTCADKNEKYKQLESNQIEIVKTKPSNNNIDLQNVVEDLATRGINEVLVEAGPTLVGGLLESALVDEMIVYIAPHIMGHSSNGLAKLDFIQTMQDRIELEICQIRKVGSDLKLQLKPKY
jgi:diaminohydroxyphosphoribosylaminopyrimidine deaminase/5-amino-6-(5-phosphoribosylamino)uracil reductase